MVNVNTVNVVKVELPGVILVTYKNCIKIEGDLKIVVYQDRKSHKNISKL